MKFQKRLLTLFLAVCVICSTVVVAFAAEECEHDYKETVLKAATCQASGVSKFVCEKCDKSEYRATAIGKHTVKEGTLVETAATCGEDGEKTYTCSLCEKEITEVIPATGKHTFEDKLVDATCTDDVKAGLVCKDCDAVKGEFTVIPGTAIGHEWDKGVEKKAATCEEAGEKLFTCATCEETKTEEIKALGHKWEKEGTVTDADCENGQYVSYKCENEGCEEIKKEETGLTPALGHKYEAKVVEPTCEAGGYTEHICSVCGDNYKDTETEKVADAHVAKVANALKAPTCTETGVGKMVCELCGESLGYAAIPAAHSWDEGKVTEDATCKDKGEMTFTCEACGETKTEEIDALGHTWDEGTETKAPTCGDEGEMTLTCTVCSEKKTEEIKATGKHEFAEGFVEATCTEPEMAGKICTVCGDTDGELTPVKDSKPTGHKEKDDIIKAATCDEDGEKNVVCSVCEEVLEEKVVIKATGHEWEYTELCEADCENGEYALYTCSVCKETMKEETGLTPALGHDYEKEVVAPTCKDKGYTEYTCARCDNNYREDETDAIADAHVAVVGTELKAATCTTTGVGKMVCDICDESLGYAAIPAAHSWDEGEITKAPKCEKKGKMTFTCTVCEKTKTEDIEATGHEWDDGEVTTAPTCGKEGKKTFKCKNCEETKTEKIKATGDHTFGESVVDATCTEPEMVGMVCSVCGEREGDFTIVPDTAPKGHEEAVEVTKEATCTKEGKMNIVCSVCEEVLEKDVVIPAKGHSWDEGTFKDADCENAQRVEYKCTVKDCDGKKVEETGIAAALGHDYKAEVVAPTCKDKGYTEYTCARCDDSYKQDETEIDADAHILEYNVLREATCTVAGVRKAICSGCDFSEYQSYLAEHTYGEELVSEDETYIYKKCSACDNEQFIAYVDHEHKNDDGVVTAPTCTEEGYTTYTCKICQEKTVADKVAALGHTEVVDAAVAATCTEAGKTEGKHCSVCETVLVAQETVEAKGHTYSDGKCSVCGEKDPSDTVPAHTHRYSISSKLNGYGKCTICGEYNGNI